MIFTETEEVLLKAFDDVIWQAMRYANGRHTYAPSMVRDAIKSVQSVCPDWKLRPDPTLAEDRKRFGDKKDPLEIESDWLDDLVKEEV